MTTQKFGNYIIATFNKRGLTQWKLITRQRLLQVCSLGQVQLLGNYMLRKYTNQLRLLLPYFLEISLSPCLLCNYCIPSLLTGVDFFLETLVVPCHSFELEGEQLDA